eukprot:TRINITY_DN61976_c0_g1_i1.p1 TRINITY_DN61976_c0_g1~~TRINITY_DN61976_c0_g1_i1.p1  ORF type:complete len:135 (+),score=31.28 TRINITY_DN61976_c0_g1_i1:180-584(+)
MGQVCCAEDVGEAKLVELQCETLALGAVKPQAAVQPGPGEQSPKKVEADLLLKLAGDWIREADKVSLGKVAAGSMCWAAAYKTAPSKLSQVGPMKVMLDLEGEGHIGSVTLGEPAKISWDDGEVWLRRNIQKRP